MPDVSKRSTHPPDFQDLPQAIGAMAKKFFDGSAISLHAHKRHQLLYAVCGVMRLNTERTSLVVPPDHAVFIPAETLHTIGIHGDVDMRTLYIAPWISDSLKPGLRVLTVSALLRELILELSQEPVDYEADSRAARIAHLIECEINRADVLSLSVPLPRDPRLQRLCAAILADPSDNRTLNNWSEIAGASPRTLARLFESDLGMGFREWRQRSRFHLALEALSNGVSVARVAIDSGYNSPSAFTAAFSKTMGLKPSEIA